MLAIRPWTKDVGYTAMEKKLAILVSKMGLVLPWQNGLIVLLCGSGWLYCPEGIGDTALVDGGLSILHRTQLQYDVKTSESIYHALNDQEPVTLC